MNTITIAYSDEVYEMLTRISDHVYSDEECYNFSGGPSHKRWRVRMAIDDVQEKIRRLQALVQTLQCTRKRLHCELGALQFVLREELDESSYERLMDEMADEASKRLEKETC